MPSFLDLVPEQHPHLFPRRKKKDGTIENTSKTEWKRDALGKRFEHTVIREAGDITGVTLHQTACVFGPLDDPEKRYRRALNVPVPVLAFRDGVYTQAAPLLWSLYSANALNPVSYSLECEGHYPGLIDDPLTPRREDQESFWGKTQTPLTPEALDCFREALRFLVEEGRALGSPVKYIWAHRQSNKDRRSDPGQELWTEVAEWGTRELGLTARYSDTFRDGRPVPSEWAAGGVGRY